MRSRDGNLLKEKGEIENRWIEHFHDLLNQSRSVDAKSLSRIPGYLVTEKYDEPPILEEVQKALKSVPNGEAPGIDRVATELLKERDRGNVGASIAADGAHNLESRKGDQRIQNRQYRQNQ